MTIPAPTKRALIKPKAGAIDKILGTAGDCGNILAPLARTGGMLFPYTPIVQFSNYATYEEFAFTHSNYKYHNFRNSFPDRISVSGLYTAQTVAEGKYMIGALHFLRSVTKMSFGLKAVEKGTAGVPPPVLLFSYLGEFMFNDVPVVVENFSYTLEDTVDYVSIDTPGTAESANSPLVPITEGIPGTSVPLPPSSTPGSNSITYVPTRLILVVTLLPQYNVKNLRDNFDLEEFRKGALIKSNGEGFI